jgi:hypothetical protein
MSRFGTIDWKRPQLPDSGNCEVKTRPTLLQAVADESVELGADCDFVSVAGFTVWQFHEIGMR